MISQYKLGQCKLCKIPIIVDMEDDFYCNREKCYSENCSKEEGQVLANVKIGNNDLKIMEIDMFGKSIDTTGKIRVRDIHKPNGKWINAEIVKTEMISDDEDTDMACLYVERV